MRSSRCIKGSRSNRRGTTSSTYVSELDVLEVVKVVQVVVEVAQVLKEIEVTEGSSRSIAMGYLFHDKINIPSAFVEQTPLAKPLLSENT